MFPYRVEWRWSTASGIVGSVPFGLNIDYGFFTGRVRLDDGREIEVRESDGLWGSTEAVRNRW